MARKAEICAANNVDWYRAVFRSRGLSSAIADGLWTSTERAPPYYSNAVTLARADPAGQAGRIAALAAELRRPFSVKDSFANLDLTELGFRKLFAAEWICRSPGDLPPESGETEWRSVTTAAELLEWEDAWRAGGSPADMRIFLPPLLAEPGLVILAARSNGRVVAGAAANQSEEGVGFSNFFTLAGDVDDLFAGALAATSRFAPDLPIVGYDRDEALLRATRFGFSTVGSLRVWVS